MPSIAGLLETSLYVDDLARVSAFYEEVLALPVMFESDRLIAHDAGRQGVLLLFRKGSTSADIATPRGTILGHEGAGRLHLAFAIQAAEYEAWKRRLAAYDVAVESEVGWSRGGRSLYFHDPDGNVVELATPGLWPNY
jgi:catechol 2,3-dioxygenase-like lactoylglutathione lyase family enzyme